MTIEISPADVREAEDFLATVVAEQVPDGRYTDGTALRDLVIKGLAVISAQLRKENKQVQSMQSLLRLRQLAANTIEANLDPAVIDATDALLSNWFVSRKAGSFSRGLIQVFVSRKQDYVITRTRRIPYDRSRAFYVDAPTDVVVPASDVTPLVDATGAVTAYVFSLRVIAEKTGDNYDVSPATWVGTGSISPFVLRITSAVAFSGGKGRESTLTVIDRASNATAVRNLINGRSVIATLTEQFSDVSRLVTIGMGEPEMQRDERGGIHYGGHYDTYLELPVGGSTFEGVLGAAYPRPDNLAVVFRDSAVPDWTATDVQPGDVIRISAGISTVPRDFVILYVFEQELQMHPLHAFPEVSFAVTYQIYRPIFGPDTQIYPSVGTSSTGQTLATTTSEGTAVLPPEPHYDILDVAIVNPDPGDPYINGTDGFIHFTNRVNSYPELPDDPGAALPYQIVSGSPVDAQSSRAFDRLVLPEDYDGYRVRVSYQTLVGFAAVDSYMRDRFQRVLCANVQAKGYHPIYLSFTVPYQLRKQPSGFVNELAVRQNLVAMINSFDPREVLDASDIATYLRNLDTNIGAVLPFEITYELTMPDGNLVTFRTNDVVSVNVAKIDAVETGRTYTTTELTAQSVTDRTVRYLTRLDRVNVEFRL